MYSMHSTRPKSREQGSGYLSPGPSSRHMVERSGRKTELWVVRYFASHYPLSMSLLADVNGWPGTAKRALSAPWSHPLVWSCGAILSPRPHAVSADVSSGGQERARIARPQGLVLDGHEDGGTIA